MRSTSFRLTMLLACTIFLATGVAVAHGQGAALARAPHPAATPEPKAQRTRVARLDKPFSLRPGQWAILADTPDAFGVQFAATVEDTRCPSDLNCFHGGLVTLDLAFQLDGEVLPERQSINTLAANGENVVAAAGYVVELLEVSPPAPPSNRSISPDAYRASLVVRAAPEPTPEPTPTPGPTREPTPLPTPIRSEENSFAAALGQPFALIPGQTAQIPEEEFSLTLRSLSDDSGCFTADDCSTMIADGTLALKHGAQKELLTFNASFSPDGPFVYEFDGYEVRLLHVMRAEAGGQVATFLVDAKQPAFVPVPAPEWVKRCPDFSRFDAAAVLQTDVQSQAVANLVFGPLAVDGPVPTGLCGYVSQAFTPEEQVPAATPYLATAVDADFAVAAGRLAGTDLLGLLHLFTTVHAADPDAEAFDMALLKTQLAAGLTDEFLGTLHASVAESPDVTVDWLEGVGDEALWLWTPTADGAYVLLLARAGTSFRVVQALVGADATEAELLDYGLALLKKL